MCHEVHLPHWKRSHDVTKCQTKVLFPPEVVRDLKRLGRFPNNTERNK